MSFPEPSRMFEGLFWVFALLSFGLGVVLYVLQGDPLAQSLRPLFPMALGGVAVCIAQQGVHAGRIRARRRYVEREEHPKAFWGLVVLNYVIGATLIGAGLWLSLSGAGGA